MTEHTQILAGVPFPEAGVTPVTVVVPCYNEEEGLPYLAERLGALALELGDSVPLSIILVDDGSTDTTWEVMQCCFGGDPSVTVRFRVRVR